MNRDPKPPALADGIFTAIALSAGFASTFDRAYPVVMEIQPIRAQTNSDCSSLREVLAGHPEIRLAILFGSLVKGCARPDSDLDLAVDAGRLLDAEESLRLIQELAAASGRPVDLIDLHRAGPVLLRQILLYGRRLAGSSAEQARWMVRYVNDAEDFLPGLRDLLA